MQTMIPANSTARPEVLTALTIGRLDVVAGHEALAVPGHDEQRVVDAHAEADQQDQLGREHRHLEDVAEQADHADGRAERRQRRQQGQGHGEDRAEDEEQHDGGQQHAEPGAAERTAGRPARRSGRTPPPGGAGPGP